MGKLTKIDLAVKNLCTVHFSFLFIFVHFTLHIKNTIKKNKNDHFKILFVIYFQFIDICNYVKLLKYTFFSNIEIHFIT